MCHTSIFCANCSVNLSLNCKLPRLPKVKEIAPEYYEMPCYDSWTGVIYKYITDPEIGPYSRIKRGITTG